MLLAVLIAPGGGIRLPWKHRGTGAAQGHGGTRCAWPAWRVRGCNSSEPMSLLGPHPHPPLLEGSKAG